MYCNPTALHGHFVGEPFSCADLRYNIEYKFERKAV